MVKIAHEAPISIIEEVGKLTDYSYCLVHLLEEQPKYLEYFEKCRDEGREVILDNSIFELGTAFDADKFAGWVKRMRPDEYIIPDVLENCDETIDSAKKWMDKYHDLPGKKIGVVQGKTFQDIVECYSKLVMMKVDKIAISFDYSYYEKSFNHSNKLVQWMMGRINLMYELQSLGMFSEEIPIHLLGCSLPQEFRYYRDLHKYIESIDTSNPVVAGIKGHEYKGLGGLLHKPSIKLFKLINYECNAVEKDKIRNNIQAFRSITNGVI